MSITLKAARVNKGLTQKEAANLLGIAVGTLNQYEAGRTFPDVPVIKKIEELYGVSYNEIDFFRQGKRFNRYEVANDKTGVR